MDTRVGDRTRLVQRDRAYWLRLLRLTVFALGAAIFVMVFIAPSLFGALGMWWLTHPQCAGDGGRTPGDFGHAYEEVVVVARETGDAHRGFYIPSRNGAHVIVPPPLNSARGHTLHEIDVLARHGYGVLSYESRACNGAGRVTSLGYLEVEDLAGALNWLLARPDVDPERIGVHGFSSAGATATMAAARYPQLRAVVAEGGYHDLGPGTLGVGGNIVEAAVRAAAALTYHLATGVDIREVSPIAVIGQVAPRPILLIYGSREVTLRGAREQLAAAGENAALWEVPGAGHGDYVLVAPEAYARRLVAFFDAALLGE